MKSVGLFPQHKESIEVSKTRNTHQDLERSSHQYTDIQTLKITKKQHRMPEKRGISTWWHILRHNHTSHSRPKNLKYYILQQYLRIL